MQFVYCFMVFLFFKLWTRTIHATVPCVRGWSKYQNIVSRGRLVFSLCVAVPCCCLRDSNWWAESSPLVLYTPPDLLHIYIGVITCARSGVLLRCFNPNSTHPLSRANTFTTQYGNRETAFPQANWPPEQ